MGKIKFGIYNTPTNGSNQSIPYARMVSRGTKRMKDICDVVSDSCSITSSDIKAVLEAFTLYIGRELSEGYSVELEGLGHFSPSLKSEQKVNEKGKKIYSAKVNSVKFRCSLRLKKMVQEGELEKIKRTNIPKENKEGRMNKMVEHLKVRKSINVSTYARLNECSKYVAKNDLKDFVEDNILQTSGKSTHQVYVLAEQL